MSFQDFNLYEIVLSLAIVLAAFVFMIDKQKSDNIPIVLLVMIASLTVIIQAF